MPTPRSSPSRFSLFRHAPAVLAAAAVVVLAGGCSIRGAVTYIFGPNQVMEGLNPEYSFNVLSPPWWWPDEDTFDPEVKASGKIQKEYYRKHGPPDFLRLWYNNDGATLARSVVYSRKSLPEPKGVSWIYSERRIEVTFTQYEAVEKPLNDEVATLCEHGDPDEIKFLGNESSVRMVRYIYWRQGLHIDFRDFKKVEEKKTKELPGWLRS